jgi:hypothetical protein
VANKLAKPAYKMKTELLPSTPILFIVLEAPITKRKSENAANIGSLL